MISVSASLSYFSIPITTTATNNTHMHPIKISMVRTDTLILSYIRSFMDLFFRRSFSSCSRLFSSVSSSKVFSSKASTAFSAASVPVPIPLTFSISSSSPSPPLSRCRFYQTAPAFFPCGRLLKPTVHKNGRWNSSAARFLTVPKQSVYYFFAMYFLMSRAIATTITIPCAMY